MVTVQEDLGRRLRRKTAQRGGRQMPLVPVRGLTGPGIGAIHLQRDYSITRNISRPMVNPAKGEEKGSRSKRRGFGISGTSRHMDRGILAERKREQQRNLEEVSSDNTAEPNGQTMRGRKGENGREREEERKKVRWLEEKRRK